MSLRAAINKYSQLPERGVSIWIPGRIEDIEAAILFVMATWSGQALSGFCMLTAELLNAENRPTVLVCDIDELPVAITQQLGPLRGVGETFWVHGGNVIASLRGYDAGWAELVARNNQTLAKLVHG